MRVLDHDIDRQPAEVELDLGADYRDLEDLLRESDSVSLQGVPESSLTITETPAQNQCASYGTAKGI